MRFVKILSLVLFTTHLLYSNPNYIEPIHIQTEILTIDGFLNEKIWGKANPYSDFTTFEPGYGEPLSRPTTVYTAYDNKNLYFAFVCKEPDPDNIVATMTKRDNIFSEDWVMILLDNFNDQESAYEFAVNPYGIQGDLIFDGSGDDASHDFIWESAARITDQGYTVEVAIPLKSIRFKPDETVEMGIGFVRYMPLLSEKGSLPAVDPEGGALLGQLNKIQFKNLSFQRNYEILPSITQNIKYINEAGELERDFSRNEIGVTTKMSLTPTLTIDATYNPDFSHVEADAAQVTKNLRTDIFYSEKRAFFMEGNEKFKLAGANGYSKIHTAVHTRRIIDPVAGLKLSGKIGRRGSISSILAIDESPKHDEDLVNKNAYHGIFRYKQLMKNSSYLGGFYTTKILGEENISTFGSDVKYHINGKSRVEANGILTSYTEENKDRIFSHNIDMQYAYDTEKYTAGVSLHQISKDFLMSSGFWGRDGLTTLTAWGFHNIYPQESWIQKFEYGVTSYLRNDLYYNKNEHYVELNYRINLPGNTTFMNWVESATEVYEDDIYRCDEIGAFFRSQLLKDVIVHGVQRYGNGVWYEDELQAVKNTYELTLQFKPNANFQSSFSHVRARYKNKKSGEELMDYQIYRNRTTYQINKYLFLRSTIDYNAYEKELLTDFLVSFTYIPGTVIHIGYGSLYEKTKWNTNQRDYIDADEFLAMERGLFVKASYNWRL
ncbi:MAG: carbohydrate binding family 9 domain-containing protein [bacterium]